MGNERETDPRCRNDITAERDDYIFGLFQLAGLLVHVGDLVPGGGDRLRFAEGFEGVTGFLVDFDGVSVAFLQHAHPRLHYARR